jgi:hypothetical protein
VTAILRSNAIYTSQPAIGEATLSGGGGDGRALVGLRPAKVKPKVRYSHDPAAELMPAAEFLGADPDFGAILEDFGDSPFNPERRRVLGRLAGVFAMDYQSGRSQERAFLRRLLTARNAREGYAANCALHLCSVPHAVRRTLALGVAESRWQIGPQGGFLGAVQARMAATTLGLLGPSGREQIWDLLTLAGKDRGELVPHADPVIERALVLKALAARRHRLGPWSTTGAAALSEVAAFANEIRGVRREVLAARTTLVPDPAGVAHATLVTLTVAERAAYCARGDIDPVWAWAEHQKAGTPMPHLGPGTAQAKAQDSFLELPELDRRPLLERPRLHQALAEARARLSQPDVLLSASQIEALADYLAGAELFDTRTAYKDEALQIIGKRGFDVIRLESLEAIRTDAQGIYKFDAAAGLGLLLSRYTGAMYVRRVFSDQMTAGVDPINQISTALKRGLAVPLVVRELRLPVVRAWAVLEERSTEGQVVFNLRRPDTEEDVDLRAMLLLAPKLPDTFGKQARAEMFLAPAALDLLAPPFGLPFAALGITDAL